MVQETNTYTTGRPSASVPRAAFSERVIFVRSTGVAVPEGSPAEAVDEGDVTELLEAVAVPADDEATGSILAVEAEVAKDVEATGWKL